MQTLTEMLLSGMLLITLGRFLNDLTKIKVMKEGNENHLRANARCEELDARRATRDVSVPSAGGFMGDCPGCEDLEGEI